MKHLIDSAFKTLESVMGETITVFPHDGSPSFEIRGLFEETSTYLDLSGSREVLTTDPHVTVRYEDNEVIKGGDKVEISGRCFIVNSSQIDGHGNYRLDLHDA